MSEILLEQEIILHTWPSKLELLLAIIISR